MTLNSQNLCPGWIEIWNLIRFLSHKREWKQRMTNWCMRSNIWDVVDKLSSDMLMNSR